MTAIGNLHVRLTFNLSKVNKIFYYTLLVLKFAQYWNSRSAGCANFSTARNIICAKSFAVEFVTLIVSIEY